MENLHAPVIPSGPISSEKNLCSVPNEDLTFVELQARKDNLESEIRTLGSVLKSHHVDMQTPLLTFDGFPRADVDVALIRTTRARINVLLNDLKELMGVIENRLHAHFSQLVKTGATSDETNIIDGKSIQTPIALGKSATTSLPLSSPFAKVNSIVENSPASSAGLKVGDLIREFGYVNITNHDSLKRLSECVQVNKDRDIYVKVSRPSGHQTQELGLSLRPSTKWGGKGLLGCHILPL